MLTGPKCQSTSGHNIVEKLAETKESIAVAIKPRLRPNYKVDMSFLMYTFTEWWINFMLQGPISV
jgi:hypothetical protein